MKPKNLSEFISIVGDEYAASLFGVTERAAKSWRLHQRIPLPKQAVRIVEVTAKHKLGPITFSGIYQKHARKAKAL